MSIRRLRQLSQALDLYLSAGAAAVRLARISANRMDIQIVLYRGQFRIGYSDEPHEDLGHRVGICDVEPQDWEWDRAADYAASVPQRVSA